MIDWLFPECPAPPPGRGGGGGFSSGRCHYSAPVVPGGAVPWHGKAIPSCHFVVEFVTCKPLTDGQNTSPLAASEGHRPSQSPRGGRLGRGPRGLFILSRRCRLGVSARTGTLSRRGGGREALMASSPPLLNLPPHLLRIGSWPRCGTRGRDRRGSNLGGPQGWPHGDICTTSTWQSPAVCRWQGSPT